MPITDDPAPHLPAEAPTVDAPRLVGYIMARDEERNIRRAVTSLVAVADEVLVVDSLSTDATRDIAAACGATVVEHPFVSYSDQRNWALDQITERWGADVWVFTLDADEWLSDELAAELARIRDTGAAGIDDADLYLVGVRRRFDGRVLRHGGFGRSWVIRLGRAGYARYGTRGANETFEIPDDARLQPLAGWLEHADVQSWERYIAKHNQYSGAEAEARLKVRAEGQQVVTLPEAMRNRALRRRFLRQRVWDLLPDAGKPALRFVQIYVVFGGFLDGRSGFERALFEAWQEMCTDLKARELERAQDRRDA